MRAIEGQNSVAKIIWEIARCIRAIELALKQCLISALTEHYVEIIVDVSNVCQVEVHRFANSGHL